MIHNVLKIQVLNELSKSVLFERELEVNCALQFPFEKTIEVLKLLFEPLPTIVNISCSSYISKN